MSLETELTRDHKMSDDQEAPTYGEAFPPLPVAEGNGDVPPLWANPKVRPSVVTQVSNNIQSIYCVKMKYTIQVIIKLDLSSDYEQL